MRARVFALPDPRSADPGTGGVRPRRPSGVPFNEKWLKVGGWQESRGDGQRPSGWLIGERDRRGGKAAHTDNVLPSQGLGRPGGIVIELVEVRAPLNEAKRERGNEGPGIMRPK